MSYARWRQIHSGHLSTMTFPAGTSAKSCTASSRSASNRCNAWRPTPFVAVQMPCVHALLPVPLRSRGHPSGLAYALPFTTKSMQLCFQHESPFPPNAATVPARRHCGFPVRSTESVVSNEVSLVFAKRIVNALQVRRHAQRTSLDSRSKSASWLSSRPPVRKFASQCQHRLYSFPWRTRCKLSHMFIKALFQFNAMEETAEARVIHAQRHGHCNRARNGSKVSLVCSRHISFQCRNLKWIGIYDGADFILPMGIWASFAPYIRSITNRHCGLSIVASTTISPKRHIKFPPVRVIKRRRNALRAYQPSPSTSNRRLFLFRAQQRHAVGIQTDTPMASTCCAFYGITTRHLFRLVNRLDAAGVLGGASDTRTAHAAFAISVVSPLDARYL